MPEGNQKTMIIAGAVALGTGLFVASKTVRVLAIAGGAAYAVYRLRSQRDPWMDVSPPRAR
jgi:hypothetical protein